MKIFSYIFIVLLVILGITFALLNANQVNIDYYIGTIKSPLSLLLILSFTTRVKYFLNKFSPIFIINMPH